MVKFMKLKDFIKDRLKFAIIYFMNTFLVILVLYLTLVINKIKIKENNILYAILLSISLFAIFLIYDYYKNKSFYKHLNNLLKAEDDLDYILNIGNTANREQEMYKEVLIKAYKVFEGRSLRHEDNHKKYIYFINQWVHQMKTPVSVINLIVQEHINEENRKVLDSIYEENEKLSHGLDIMLYNARINDFNIDFNVVDLNLVQIVRKVINDNKKPLIRYNIFPRINNTDDINVNTDEKWLYFVINQILNNAIKYSKSENKEKRFITFTMEEEASKVILSISDEGIGIPKEDLNRIFQPFFTGKNGRETSESTGMGMYLSKKICEHLGHELLVESSQRKGSTFSIVFYKGKNLFRL